MNKIVLTIVATTLFCATVFFFYKIYPKGNGKDKKLFRESLSREVIIITFIAPFVGSVLLTFLISLIFLEGDTETFFKSDVALLISTLYLYGIYSVSMGIHALAKTFKPKAISTNDHKLVELLRFFHGPFSHILSNLSGTILFSLLLFYNTNHPSTEALSGREIAVVILSGLTLGILLAIIYAIGNALRLMLWSIGIMFLPLVYFAFQGKASIVHAPLSIFVLTTLGTSFIVLLANEFGPKKNWFMKTVDEKFVSVDKDWSSILQQFQK